MRFSIQSIKKLVTTGTWKIAGTWDAIGFVAGPRDGSCSLSRRFPQFRDSLPCCGQKSWGGKGNLRDNDGRSIPSHDSYTNATYFALFRNKRNSGVSTFSRKSMEERNDRNIV